jgi:hypothetical protein
MEYLYTGGLSGFVPDGAGDWILESSQLPGQQDQSTTNTAPQVLSPDNSAIATFPSGGFVSPLTDSQDSATPLPMALSGHVDMNLWNAIPDTVIDQDLTFQAPLTSNKALLQQKVCASASFVAPH